MNQRDATFAAKHFNESGLLEFKIKCVAMDPDGFWFGYETMPEKDVNRNEWVSTNQIVCLGKSDDWKKSLAFV
jgi:hypothetical protein